MDDEHQAEVLLDEYLYLHEHPIPYDNLNTSTLHLIPELTEEEVGQISALLEKYPEPSSWGDLRQSLSDEVQEILAYTVGIRPVSDLSGHVRWRMKTLNPGEYQWYTRFRIRKGSRFTGTIVAERDPGEISLMDHVAGGIEYRSPERNWHLVIGQFQLGYGQGLSFGRPLGFSKSSDAIRNADKSYTALRSSSSSLEFSGLQGIAGKYTHGNHVVQAFLSSTPRDGRWDGREIHLSTSGLHTTEYMRSIRNDLVESVRGMGYWYQIQETQIGFQAADHSYHRWGHRERLEPKIFGSFWVSTPWFTHETALDYHSNRAHYTTLRKQLYGYSVVFGHRYYEPKYQVPYANGLSEYAGTSNESGIYFGIRWDVGAFRWQWYFDQFRELQSGDNPIRSGTEWFMRSDWRLAPRMVLTGQIKQEKKEVTDTRVDRGVLYTGAALRRKLQYRLRWKYRWPSQIALDIRLDLTAVDLKSSQNTGIQWAYKMTFPIGIGSELQTYLMTYDITHSQASTYYVIMPVMGSMQILRQTTPGILLGARLSAEVTDRAQLAIFYLQRRMIDPKLTHTLYGQFEITF